MSRCDVGITDPSLLTELEVSLHRFTLDQRLVTRNRTQAKGDSVRLAMNCRHLGA